MGTTATITTSATTMRMLRSVPGAPRASGTEPASTTTTTELLTVAQAGSGPQAPHDARAVSAAPVLGSSFLPAFCGHKGRVKAKSVNAFRGFMQVPNNAFHLKIEIKAFC